MDGTPACVDPLLHRPWPVGRQDISVPVGRTPLDPAKSVRRPAGIAAVFVTFDHDDRPVARRHLLDVR